ncbi:hypothetical protein, partial [Mycobacterium tuberculosis]|uniref:hypothetical protein n=1 Tax=Mycobacterium tuberculosis TaxID=1773 RepID=UPI001BA5780D
ARMAMPHDPTQTPGAGAGDPGGRGLPVRRACAGCDIPAGFSRWVHARRCRAVDPPDLMPRWPVSGTFNHREPRFDLLARPPGIHGTMGA